MYAIWPIAFWNLLPEFYLSMSKRFHIGHGISLPIQYNKVPALLKRWIAATTGGIICISDDLHHEILIAIYFDLWLSLHQFWNKLD